MSKNYERFCLDGGTEAVPQPTPAQHNETTHLFIGSEIREVARLGLDGEEMQLRRSLPPLGTPIRARTTAEDGVKGGTNAK